MRQLGSLLNKFTFDLIRTQSYTNSLASRTPLVKLLRRSIHSSLNLSSAKQSPLYVLRKRTGYTYNLCREALDKFDNDIDKASDWLQAHALAHGIQKASKVGNRRAGEGLICMAIERGNKAVNFVEINCETDFVAKNQLFKDLAIDLTNQFASFKLDVNQSESRSTCLKILRPSDEQHNSLKGQIVPTISKLSENIRISRAIRYTTHDSAEFAQVFGKIHSQSIQKTIDQYEIVAGRFGALVTLKSNQPEMNDLKSSGDLLCRHVIGFNPTYIELPAAIRIKLEEEERSLAEKRREEKEQIQQDGEECSDHEGHITSHSDRDDWPSIMDQTLISSDTMSVREFCAQNNFSIVHFERYECGTDQHSQIQSQPEAAAI